MVEQGYFGNLQLNKKVIQAIHNMGFEEPSPIQAEAIPYLIQGLDLVGQAQTGTGKTAAFGIPIVEKVNPRYKGVQALILTPTRELAIQVAEEISKIGKFRGVKTLPIYGGQPIDRQIRALKQGVQIVIGTPGRILDHLSRKTLYLEKVNMLVLDEADEMLDMGFVEDIEMILSQTPETRQTILFSATMPEPIQRLTKKYLKEPKWITVSKDELTVPLIDQVYFEIKEKDRLEALCRYLDSIDMSQAIIFCRTKKGVDDLTQALHARGYGAEALHGDLTQVQRDKVMRKFRDGTAEILIATDVAARGIDVENVSHVLNYEVPQDPESYVHRIGRTGRAGRTGVAVTFLVPREYKQLRLIEKAAKTTIQRGTLPSLADVAQRQTELIKNQISKLLVRGNLEIYRDMVKQLNDEFSTEDIAAAALGLALDLDDQEFAAEEPLDFGNTGARPGKVRFFMNVGREDVANLKDLIDFIAEEAGIEASLIGTIRMHDRFSFVEVNAEVAEKVYYCLQKTNLKSRRVNLEPARARERN